VLRQLNAAKILPEVSVAAVKLPADDEAHQPEKAAPASDAPAPYKPGNLIYALGSLNYDFGSEARRDFLAQYMKPASPFIRSDLLAYLEQNPNQIEWLTWTVNVDGTPICALQPAQPFGRDVYTWLCDSLNEWPADNSDLPVSVPGVIAGQKMLMSGQVVPLVRPTLAGMYSWAGLGVVRQSLEDGVVDPAEQETIISHIQNFQRRAYRELRNTGRSAHDRAMNFAVTMAFHLSQQQALDFARKRLEFNREAETGLMQIATYRQMRAVEEQIVARVDLELDKVEVSQSPICRSNSGTNCWDVKLILFDPDQGHTQAKTVYQFIVDVSDIVPVIIGEMAEWSTF
jgi:hypothetical protein